MVGLVVGKRSILDACNPLNVSRETIEKLEIYWELLRKWNPAINLVSKSSLDDAAQRHFADSLQLWHYRSAFRCWVDVGSGAGFPGLVLAIAAEGQGEFHLVESDARKAAFLRNVSRETNTPVEIHNARVEEIGTLQADIVSARALASLRKLFELTEKIMAPDAVCLYLKGQTCDAELWDAEKSWAFEADKFASATDENGTVLRIRNVKRVE